MPTNTGDENLFKIADLSNREFLERYARAGRIGLSGGVTLVDQAICRAERHLDDEEKWSCWSHAFLCEGQRLDGQHWVIESDLQIHRKHIQLGVQENRITKYFDEELYTSLAVLDFGLGEEQVLGLLREALELVANRERYSLRELLGTLFALRHPQLRSQNNLLARESSMYCSAFIQHLFRKAGVDLVPGVNCKNTTPEDLARTTVPHVTYCLQRRVAGNALRELRKRLRRRLGARIRHLKRRHAAA